MDPDVLASYEIPFPGWAHRRGDGWVYVGRILRHDAHPPSYDELIRRSLRSDHGETREVDEYPEGATCWCREPSPESSAANGGEV